MNYQTVLNIINSPKRIKDKINWQELIVFSSNNMIGSYIYGLLGEKITDSEVKTKFKKEAIKNLQINILLLRESKKIAHHLKTNKINYVFIKGVSLLNTIYTPINLRVLRDIDLLIKKKNLVLIKKILRKEGYCEEKLHDIHSNYWKNYSHHLPFSKKTKYGKVLVEVHWDVLEKGNPFTIKTEDILNNKKLSKSYCVPCFEDMIIISLSSLFYQQVSYYLRNFIDIKLIIKKKKINWRKLIQKSIKYGTNDVVLLGLSFMKKYFNTNIPDFVFSNLEKNSKKRIKNALKFININYIFNKYYPNKNQRFITQIRMCPIHLKLYNLYKLSLLLRFKKKCKT